MVRKVRFTNYGILWRSSTYWRDYYLACHGETSIPIVYMIQVDFLVIKIPSVYNAILGWPSHSINVSLDAKIPSKARVRCSPRRLGLTWQCYVAALQEAKQSRAIFVKGLDIQEDLIEEHGEPQEDLVEVSWEYGNKEHTTWSGLSLDELNTILLLVCRRMLMFSPGHRSTCWELI